MMQKIDVITEIRGFNRFYTEVLGLLDEYLLHSDYSLTEVRVLFEISKTDCCTANQLCSLLDIDRSYMSRMISKFEEQGILTRRVSDTDSRNMYIKLTEKGQKIFRQLNDSSNQQIEKLIENLSEEECEKLIASMRVVKKCFSSASKEIRIRPYQPEDLDYVLGRQISMYETERNFHTDVWKGYLVDGIHKLVEQFDPSKDGIWILECDSHPAGCIAVTHDQEGAAQLRYFFLEPELRGMGAGTRLLNTALDFCREKKYTHAFLWTVSAQETARILYQKAGFQITETEENSEWGVPVLEERWDMDL